MAQLVKHLPAVWETWVQFLGWNVPLEKQDGALTHNDQREPLKAGHTD